MFHFQYMGVQLYFHFLGGKTPTDVDATSRKHLLFDHIFITGLGCFLIYFLLPTEILSHALSLYSEIAGL